MSKKICADMDCTERLCLVYGQVYGIQKAGKPSRTTSLLWLRLCWENTKIEESIEFEQMG